MTEKIRLRVCSSIVEQDGKFAVMIHWGDGTPIIQSDFRFTTVDEAKAAGTAILNEGMKLAKEKGVNIWRPAADTGPEN